MWDRLRSATGGGGGGGGGGADNAVDQYQGRTTITTTPLGRKDRASNLTNMSSNNSSWTGNSTASWQPRSSVIAAREGQQQQQQQQERARQTKAGPPPPRPPRDFQLHPSSSSSFEPQQRSQRPLPPSTSHRDSAQGRPPSSVYSQPSPLVTEFGSRAGPPPAHRYAMSPEEVSPPSSPEDVRARDVVPNHNISPIDEEDDFSPIHPRPLPEPPVKMPSSAPPPAGTGARPNIPMMRRERRAQRDAAAAASGGRNTSTSAPTDKPRGQKDPRWDPMTGEITNSDKGRPSQVKPVEFARGLGISTMASGGTTTTTTTTTMSQGVSPERERRPSSRGGPRSGSSGGNGNGVSATDPAAMAFGGGAGGGQQRPGWKGASGRTAIVDPVKDTPGVAPLKIPPRSRRREAGWTAATSATAASSTGYEQQQQQQQAVGNIRSGGGNGHRGDYDAMARLSPPISPETGPGNRGVGKERGVVIGAGGGSAGRREKEEEEEEEEGGDDDDDATRPSPSTNGNNPHLMNLQSKGGAAGGTTNSFSSTGRSLASTIRKIIPSSTATATSRLFSGASSGSTRNSPARTPDGSSSPNLTHQHQHQPSSQHPATANAEHGYPSPPLSGNAITAAAGLVNAAHSPDYAHAVNASSFGPSGATDTAQILDKVHHVDTDNDSTPTSSDFLLPRPGRLPPSTTTTTTSSSATHQPLQPLAPSSSSIRRKEVGSSYTSALTASPTTTTARHNPHESFSSSVYSRPDSYQDDQFQPPLFPRQQQHPQPPPLSHLNTKNLPNPPPPPPHGASNTTDSSYVQPPSRFSVTTYATSAHTTSERESFDVAPPLPTPPKDTVLGLNHSVKYNNNNNNNNNTQHTHQDMPGTSVLDRQRPSLRGGINKWEDPVPNSDEPPVKISLSKDWMTTAGANSSGKSQQFSPPRTRQPRGPRDIAANNNKENRGMFGFSFLGGGGPKSPASGGGDDDSRPASVLSNMDKDLPPAPAAPAPPPSSITPSTTTTADRITQLNGLLQDLANRRLNIHRAIKQMTELMPQDNLIMQEAVRRKREDEKRKIEELKRRLDDIGREEHELGMKLHRAYKKLDRAAEYEPTTLWVRRATGS